MKPESLLIAETDQRSLYILAEVLSAHIPHLVIDTCTTGNQLLHKLEGASYSTVAMSPMLLHAYTEVSPVRVPLLMTVYQRDLPLAYPAFSENAFDLIVKPIVPHDAAQTVRLALWHYKLQRLLTLKERSASRFRQHRNSSPQALKAEADFLGMLETTYRTLKTSFRLLLNIDQNSSLFDAAASVEKRARQLALDRLLNLYREGSTH
jgi:DNA-binding NtrC family response regulator